MLRDELKDALYAEADIQARDMPGIMRAIVEFVAAWIEGQDWLYSDSDREYLIKKWREEMA